MPDEIGKKGMMDNTTPDIHGKTLSNLALELSVHIVQDALEDRMKEINESIEHATHDIVKIRLQQRLHDIVNAYDEVTDLL